MAQRSHRCLLIPALMELVHNYSTTFPTLGPYLTSAPDVASHILNTRRMLLKGCFRLSHCIAYLFPYALPLVLASVYFFGLTANIVATVLLAGVVLCV